ncbi:MAG: glycosyl hydrolase family 18 protein [Oscillospiraceae bacterium]|jgi:spore germination protein
MQIYVVKPGDTMFAIAQKYGVSVQRIIIDNGLPPWGPIIPGQALLILFPDVVHTIKAGENLITIARQYNTTVLELVQNNPDLIYQQTLQPRQQLTISFKAPKERAITINGYAYPFVDRNTLLSTLPYLTMLTIFGYGFTENGELIEIDDETLIKLALDFSVKPILLLSSITETGTFSGERASYLFNSIAFQNALIEKLIKKMKQKGYLGIDIDFEFIKPADAAAYLAFLRNITSKMHANGFSVNVDLAPKTSAAQQGLLYEAHDYRRFGEIADTVLLMTYEWGYTFGPPMAVAPINKVNEVVSYALTEIPPQKIIMGIPNYGYVWTLPYIQGRTQASSIGNQQAVFIARRYGANIHYDETAQAPFFSYYTPRGSERVVWFEDVRSIKAKMDVISQNAMLGAGYWNVMRPFVQNWSYLNARFEITKLV